MRSSIKETKMSMKSIKLSAVNDYSPVQDDIYFSYLVKCNGCQLYLKPVKEISESVPIEMINDLSFSLIITYNLKPTVYLLNKVRERLFHMMDLMRGKLKYGGVAEAYVYLTNRGLVMFTGGGISIIGGVVEEPEVGEETFSI